jgi:hypothetical protein
MTITPTIHMNGTPARMLLEGYSDAYYAIDAAIEKLAAVEFNARDYYVKDGDWEKARTQREQNFKDLHAVKMQLSEILCSISEQKK